MLSQPIRLFVVSALSILSAPAFACAMYIPEGMAIASIGDLMDEVDVVEAPQVTRIDAPPAQHAQAFMIPEAADVPNAAPAIQVDPIQTEASPRLTAKERRANKRRTKTAGV